MTIKIISDQQEGLILKLLMNWLKLAFIFWNRKIRHHNLWWNENSGKFSLGQGELIGFVDLGDVNINYATLENV